MVACVFREIWHNALIYPHKKLFRLIISIVSKVFQHVPVVFVAEQAIQPRHENQAVLQPEVVAAPVSR